MRIPKLIEKKKEIKASTGNVRKHIVKGGSAVIVAVSLLTGIAFGSPADIIEDQTDARLSNPPIVMDIDEYANVDAEDDDDADEQKSTKLGVAARFRQAVLSLPSSVRILIITPLWALGTALMTLISFLWSVIFSSPIGAFIASFAIGFGVLLGLYALTAKILFPDIPLKDILSKRNVIIVAIGALILSGLDATMPLFWHQYPAVSFLVKLVLGASIVTTLSLRVKAIFNKGLLA